MCTPARVAAIGCGLFFLMITGCVPQADFDQAKSQSNDLATQLAKTKADAATTQKSDEEQIAVQKEQLQALSTELDRTKKDAGDLMTASDSLKTQMTKAKADLQGEHAYRVQADEKAKNLQTQLDALQKKSDQNLADAQKAKAQESDLEAKLQKSEADKAVLVSQVKALSEQIKQLREIESPPTTRP